MKIKHLVHNGNVEAAVNRFNVTNITRHADNRNWSARNSYGTINNYTETLQCINTTNFIDYNNQTETLVDNRKDPVVESQRITTNIDRELVCNRQYRLDTKFNTNFENSRNKTEAVNLEGATESYLTSCETFVEDSNVSVQSTPTDEERAFEHSDTDEMSDKGTLPVPRGIVNPNYPGFQHLAHTLQDYSTNIENFYHSENEMTDDDVDVEISDATQDFESKNNEMNTDLCNGNNNNDNVAETIHNNFEMQHTFIITSDEVNNHGKQSEIPDLLKTVSKNNNLDSYFYELNCSDIENNFNTKDIIGDFNKEIEDEIKQVLNYNINIQDDLEELKKDIKNNFATPIENTINNISEVVNHVIKKLVENHCDINEPEFNFEKGNAKCLVDVSLTRETAEEQNETNALKEMNLSRPTFLLLEKDIDSKISDAFLSDGKEELNIRHQDYDAEDLTNNVESTIKQLSSELRKIIPKLDELREREKLFAVKKPEPLSVLTDGNCNQIGSCSNYKTSIPINSENRRIDIISKAAKEHVGDVNVRKFGFKSKSNPKTSRDRQSDVRPSSSNRSAHNSSVQTKEYCDLGSFDVYNIETALPKLDIDAIESHLKAAKDAERRKRNDREEIRRRLAMGAEADEYYSLGHMERPGKKPSLQSRLQSGRNLQICFMNETASDNESQASDIEKNIPSSLNKNLSKMSIFSKSNYSLNNHPYQTRPLSVNISKNDKISTTVVQSGAKLRPSSLSLKTTKSRSSHSLGHIELRESDFFVLQATLQTEARIALAQAKEMARVQMERERRSRAVSPVTEMLRRSMEKANAPLAADRRRVSRHLLTDMNIAQLQVIVNELHSQIESLNESLVKLLMARDELHMGQDSMLVDIEDLTRYLGVKEQTKKTKGSSKSGMRRLTSFVHK